MGQHNKPRTIIISKQLRDEMLFHIRFQIQNNLAALEQFLTIPGYGMLCAAIYTYAIEEFGKIVLLQQSKQLPNGHYEIVYGSKKGFLDHNEKFRLADGRLPSDCIEISAGSFSRESYDRHSYDTPTPADWETRLLIFHTNFDNTFTGIAKPHEIDSVLLKKAVQEIKKYLTSYQLP